MIRYIGAVSMSGGFLMISPTTRELVGGWGLKAKDLLLAYSPYSWAALAGAALLAMWLLARSVDLSGKHPSNRL